MKISASEIAHALSGKRAANGQFMCLCPAHDDKNPSLSITEKDGKTLVHCHAGCPKDKVINALKEKGLWLNSEVAVEKNEQKPKVVDLTETVIEYQKALSRESVEFLMKERMISLDAIKTFQIGQRHDRITIPIMDENGIMTGVRGYLPPSKRKAGDAKVLPQKNGDGSPKLFPQQIIPWLQKCKDAEKSDNLEQLENLGNLDYLKAPKFIVLCEGEMDALALISNGIIALTNTCGAGTWKDEFTKQIVEIDMPVVVLMDNDLAGETGKSKRVEALLDQGMIVSAGKWSGDRPSGHDVTDEIKNYGIDSLLNILSKSEKYSDIIFMNDVVAEPVDWIISPYLAKGKTSLLEGEPGIGKSYLSLYIAALISTGTKNPFNKENTIPIGKVLLMSAEDGLGDTIKPRLENMISDLHKIFAPREIFTLDEKGFEKLDLLIAREKPLLVIIDPLTPFLDGKKDVNHAKDMRPFFKELSRLAAKYNCAILVTRHLAKSKDHAGISRGLGSIDIAAAVRSILQVTSDTENKNLKRVTHIKCNIAAKGKPFGYTLEKNHFNLVIDISATEDTEENKSELERACEFLKDALAVEHLDAEKVKAAAKDAGISVATLNRAKKVVGIKSKRITNEGKVTLWVWSLPNSVRGQHGQESQGVQDNQVSQKPYKHFHETDSDKD